MHKYYKVIVVDHYAFNGKTVMRSVFIDIHVPTMRK